MEKETLSPLKNHIEYLEKHHWLLLSRELSTQTWEHLEFWEEYRLSPQSQGHRRKMDLLSAQGVSTCNTLLGRIALGIRVVGDCQHSSAIATNEQLENPDWNLCDNRRWLVERHRPVFSGFECIKLIPTRDMLFDEDVVETNRQPKSLL